MTKITGNVAIFAAIAAFAPAAMAQDTGGSSSESGSAAGGDMSCEEFLLLDTAEQGEVLYRVTQESGAGDSGGETSADGDASGASGEAPSGESVHPGIVESVIIACEGDASMSVSDAQSSNADELQQGESSGQSAN